MTQNEELDTVLLYYAAIGDPALDELCRRDSEEDNAKYKHIVYGFLFFLHGLISMADFKKTGDLKGQVDYKKSQFYNIQFDFELGVLSFTDVREQAVSLFRDKYSTYTTPTEVDEIVNKRVYQQWNFSPLYYARLDSYK